MRLPDFDTGLVATAHANGAGLAIDIQNKTQYWRRVAFLGVKSVGTQSVLVGISNKPTMSGIDDPSDTLQLFSTIQDPLPATLSVGNAVSATSTGVHINFMKYPQMCIWWPPGFYFHLYYPTLVGGGSLEYYRLMCWTIERSVYPDWYNNIMEIG